MTTQKFLLVILVLLAAVAFAQDTAVQSLRDADQNWMKVFAAHDLDRLVAACAEDGSVLASNAPIATGHDAIRKVFAEFFQLPGFKAEWHPTNVEVAKSGELGYTSGTYTLSFNDLSGNPINDRGKYVTVWRKQKDGAWKVVRDIFNSDLPAK